MNTIKILLADDHQIVIDGLKLILENREPFEVVGEVGNGQEVLDFLEKQKVHIVVLDINMPIMDGITCAKRIKFASQGGQGNRAYDVCPKIIY